MELKDDVIETGRINNVLLQTMCLPDKEPVAGSSCFTSGISRDSKIIDAVPLNVFNRTFCEDQRDYKFNGEVLNENQICAGLPSNSNYSLPFNGQYEEDFGGPLICLDKDNKIPIFTGVASSNSISTKRGYPGTVQKWH